MARLRTWICLALILGGIAGPLLHAQLSEEEKRKRAAFLKAREEMRTVASPTPSKSPSPKAKPKAATRPKKKTPKPKKTPEPEETPKPKAKPPARPKVTETPEPEETPTPKRKPTATPKPTPKESATPERESPPPRAVAVPTVTPRTAPATAAPIDEDPQVVVRKSGLEKPSGFSLPFRIFGKRYRYLSRSVRGQIDRAPVLRRRWQFIVVHNSGTRQGNARIFDYYHRNVRRMRNGMAYHFVIGNGSSSGNGEIEIGARWRRQINGGHVHSDYLNNIALGICLVGDFNRDQPTRAQLDSCEELIRYLRLRCGKIDARYASVRPHREMNPPRWATDCPGDDFPYGWFRRFRE